MHTDQQLNEICPSENIKQQIAPTMKNMQG